MKLNSIYVFFARSKNDFRDVSIEGCMVNIFIKMSKEIASLNAEKHNVRLCNKT